MSATGLITEKTHRSYLICPFQGVRWALSATGMSPKTRRYVGFVFFFPPLKVSGFFEGVFSLWFAQ